MPLCHLLLIKWVGKRIRPLDGRSLFANVINVLLMHVRVADLSPVTSWCGSGIREVAASWKVGVASFTVLEWFL